MRTEQDVPRVPRVTQQSFVWLVAVVVAAACWMAFGPNAPVAEAGKPPKAPVVSISSPANGAIFAPGVEILFAGTATDKEKGELSKGLLWTSSIDGDLYMGASFSSLDPDEDLSMGVHTIKASVTDSSGATGIASIMIAVEEDPPPPPVFGPWDIETVDSDGNVGYYSTLAFDPDDNTPAIVYSDETNGRLKFAQLNGTTGLWEIEVVDGSDSGTCDLAYDPIPETPSYGIPSVSFSDGSLKFAYLNGSSWETTELVPEGKGKKGLKVYGNTSLAYDHCGNPSIGYNWGTVGGDRDLMFARWNDVTEEWEHELVDATVLFPVYISLAYDLSGNPSIAYSDTKNANGGSGALKFARWNGSAWEIETLWANTPGAGSYASLAYDPTTGYPAIAHMGDLYDDLCGEFVSWNGSLWEFESICNDQQTAGVRPSLAFDDAGTAMVAFVSFDANDPAQRFARRNGPSNWEVETVEYLFSISAIPSLALDANGNPAMAYGTSISSGSLRFAVREPEVPDGE